VDVTPELKNGKTVIPEKAIESVRKNLIALKGPLAACTMPRSSKAT
jgi:isocitrate dehydrogenase (NAD+)